MQHRFKRAYVPAKRTPGPKRPRSSPYTASKSVGYAVAPKPPAGQEVKFFDTVFPSAAIPAGPASLIDSTLVAEIVNGTGPSDRIGRKIKVLKVDYSYTLQLVGATAIIASDAVRYDIWLDKQCNGFAPAPAELYTTAATLGTSQYPNLFNEKRFKRLYTRTRQMNSQNAVGAASACANFGMKVEGSFRPNVIIEYDASTGNITDLTSNNIFQCWSSDAAACVIAGNFVRIHYVDA